MRRPQKRLMTTSQHSRVSDLLDALGLRGSPVRDAYYSRYFKYDEASADYAAKVIARLEEELQRHRGARVRLVPRSFRPDHIAVSDLGSFSFCPASYAIKDTFELLEVPGAEEGLEEHRDSDVVERLVGNILAAPEQVENPSLSVEAQMFYSDILRSRLVVRGRDKGQEPFYSPGGELCGLPDYVYELGDGSRFLVDERHTWRRIYGSPWDNHRIQAYGYMLGLKELRLAHGYIAYFRWDPKNKGQVFDQPSIFYVDPSKKARDDLARVYRQVRELRSGGHIRFWLTNVSKCFSCSLRYYCRHKSGLLETLQLPYAQA